MKINKEQRKIANGAINDNARPVLNQVVVRNGEIATVDGFMLISTKIEYDDNDNIKRDEDLQMPSDIINKLNPNTKGYVSISQNDETLTATIYDNKKDKRNNKTSPKQRDLQYTFHKSNAGHFPEYTQLYPISEKKFQCALSSQLLKKLLSCVPDKCMICFGFTNNKDSIEFQVMPENNLRTAIEYNKIAEGLLMPMSVDWEQIKWHKQADVSKGQVNETIGENAKIGKA